MMFQQDPSARDTARLEDYIEAVRRHKLLVVGMTIGLALLAFIWANSRPSTYESSANVVLYPTPVGAANLDGQEKPNLDKEQAVLESTTTAVNAAELLDFDGNPESLLSAVRVTFVLNSDVLNVAATDGEPDRAADVANAFADAYVAEREQAAIDIFTGVEELALSESEALQEELEELDQADEQLAGARSDLLQSTPPGDLRDERLQEIDDERAAIRTRSGTLRSQIGGLEQEALRARAQLNRRTPSALVIRRAAPSSTPTGIPVNAIVMAAGFVGLIFGIVLAFLLERLDTTARDDSDVALALGSNVIGSVPTLGFGLRTGPASLIMVSPKASGRIGVAKESFRRLRSAVEFLAREGSVRSIIITSASPAEGKSLVSANLAIASAQAGSRVVLVSADLRRPSQEERFGISESKGLSTYLGGDDDILALDVDGIPNLWVVPAGDLPANPSELLGSARFGELVELLNSEVDLVIVDTPPVLSTADAAAAARHVDGVVVVVDTRRTETSDLLQVRADLERTGSRLLGAVMNRRRTQAGLLRRDKYNYYSRD